MPAQARAGRAIVLSNTEAAIEAAVHGLLDELVGTPDRPLVSVMFSTSPGLDAAFPSAAARRWGLAGVSLLGMQGAGPDGEGLWLEVLIYLEDAS